MKITNTLLIISFCCLTIFLKSCADYQYYLGEIDCQKCYKDYPEIVTIEIEFTINLSDEKVPYTIYRGYAENSPIIYHDTTSKKIEQIVLETDKIYSFVAEYYDKINKKTIYVVNECYPKPRLIREGCDEKCYFINNDYVNLKLSNKLSKK